MDGKSSLPPHQSNAAGAPTDPFGTLRNISTSWQEENPPFTHLPSRNEPERYWGKVLFLVIYSPAPLRDFAAVSKASRPSERVAGRAF